MDIREKLSAYGKKIIPLEDLAILLKTGMTDTEVLFDNVSRLVDDMIMEPVKSSGHNGNRKYPMFKGDFDILNNLIVAVWEDHLCSFAEAYV